MEIESRKEVTMESAVKIEKLLAETVKARLAMRGATILPGSDREAEIEDLVFQIVDRCFVVVD